MYAVSDAWAAANKRFLAPEGFVELSCYIPQMRDKLVYTKKDLMSFSHRQTGSLVSGELPKNHIEFTLDNSDGKWDPSNPTGLERYLSERLKIILRYGYRINGTMRWVPGGVFYLSEWRTSPNGMEASFVARDLLEYMIDKPYTGAISGTLYDIATRAIEEAGIPKEITMVLGEERLGIAMLGEDDTEYVRLSEELKNYTVGDIDYDGTETIAVILQKCANAACCVMYQNRDGVFIIDKLSIEDTGYVIPKLLSYGYPETELSRPLKDVTVSYHGGKTTSFVFGSSGETQTLDNDFIRTELQAIAVGKWVCENLRTRKKISGEFRGDPRFDLFDMVSVEDKYGTIAGVVLTDIKYTFAGAFRMAYSGYVYGSGTAAFVYSGEVYSGEVN